MEINKYKRKQNNNFPYYKFKKRFCGNCGKLGHTYKFCRQPFISLGIIAVRKSMLDGKHKDDIQNQLDSLPEVQIDTDNDIRFLMVQRRDSIGYINLLRPKHNEKKYLRTYVEDLSPYERRKIKTQSFDKLWDDLSQNHNPNWYNKERDRAKSKFQKLDIDELLDNSYSVFHHLEWTFCKGKRNMFETDLEAAIREFKEESGYEDKDFQIITKEPLIEEFVGLNKNNYLCKYYLAVVDSELKLPDIDMNKPSQAGEISNISWFTYAEALKIIRPYSQNKRKVLELAYEKCKNLNFQTLQKAIKNNATTKKNGIVN